MNLEVFLGFCSLSRYFERFCILLRNESLIVFKSVTPVDEKILRADGFSRVIVVAVVQVFLGMMSAEFYC